MEGILSAPETSLLGGVHHWDENGLRDGELDPKEIRQIHGEMISYSTYNCSNYNCYGSRVIVIVTVANRHIPHASSDDLLSSFYYPLYSFYDLLSSLITIYI